MKDKVRLILNAHALPNMEGGFIRDTVDGAKFTEIAEEIVIAICGHDDNSDKFKCDKCGEVVTRESDEDIIISYCSKMGFKTKLIRL